MTKSLPTQGGHNSQHIEIILFFWRSEVGRDAPWGMYVAKYLAYAGPGLGAYHLLSSDS